MAKGSVLAASKQRVVKRKIDLPLKSKSKKSKVIEKVKPVQRLPSPEEEDSEEEEDLVEDISNKLDSEDDSDDLSDSDDLDGSADGKIREASESESDDLDEDDSPDSDQDGEPDSEQDEGSDLSQEEDSAKSSSTSKVSSREQHQEQKRLREERRANRPNGNTIQRIKQLWERLRVKRGMPTEVRKKLVDETWELAKDQIKDLVLKHDSSRVIQTLFKYSDKSKRLVISKSLKGSYNELARSSYGKYLLIKILDYGTKEGREEILSELFGNFRKLMRHKEGAYVVEDIYRLYSTAAQRRQIIQEFYGSEFALFNDKDSPKTLKDILEKSPDKRPFILRNLRDTIASAVNKGSVGFTVFHAVMLEYIKNIDNTSTEKDEFIDLITEGFADIVHTSEGSQVACRVLAIANAKERKGLIRSLKPFAVKLIEEEHGQFVFITLLSTVDDTVLVSRAFIPEFKDTISNLLVNKSARRPFLYLLLGPSPRYFTKSVQDSLKDINELKSVTSKKDDEVRRQELLKAFSPLILEAITSSSRDILSESLGSQFVAEALLYAVGDKTEAIQAVLQALSGSPEDAEHLVHHPFTVRMLRTLIQEGHWNSKTNSVDVHQDRLGFKDLFAEQINEDVVAWATGEGSFAVVTLLENLDDKKVKSRLLTTLKNSKNDIEQAGESNKGSKLILDMI